MKDISEYMSEDVGKLIGHLLRTVAQLKKQNEELAAACSKMAEQLNKKE